MASRSTATAAAAAAAAGFCCVSMMTVLLAKPAMSESSSNGDMPRGNLFRGTGSSNRGSGPPVILEHPRDAYGVTSRPMKLLCRYQWDRAPDDYLLVQWYKDDQRIGTHFDDPNSYFSLDMQSGELLILRFLPQYAGVYYCNVTNRIGSAVSSSATVRMAYINEEFESNPRSKVAASGQDVQFSCAAPPSAPPPRLFWKCNVGGVDRAVDSVRSFAGRTAVGTTPEGLLLLAIRNVSKTDAGEYWCVAENDAGLRASSKAVLTVEERPLFILSPEDTLSRIDGSVTLHCVARSGDALATVSWLKDDVESLPSNGSGSRWRLLNDGNLSIQPVQADDEGRYTCLAHGRLPSSADNGGGASNGEAAVTRASAYLTVDTPPYVLGRPINRSAAERGTAYFHCHADSSPPPRIVWQKAGSTDLVFARSGHPNRRQLVFDNGTLRISDIRPQDSGEYNCFVINRAGSSSAKANLTVILAGGSSETLPVIAAPPKDVVASLGASVSLTCSVDGKRPTVRWLKDGRPLLAGGRFAIVGSANLRIADVQVGDAGSYTCLAMSRSGDASATAQLSVTGLQNGTAERGFVPQPPGKPQSIVFEDSAVLLSVPMRSAADAGDWMYRAEGFSYSVPEGWLATKWFYSDGRNLVFSAVIPGAAYYFVVRARNSQGGVSEPSPPSDVVQIPGSSSASGDGGPAVRQTQDAKDVISRMPVVVLACAPHAVGSTSVNVSWIIAVNSSTARLRTRQAATAGVSAFVEGFYVRAYSSSGERRTDTVFSSLSSHHLITNLEPHTAYHVTVAPFYAGETGAATKPVEVVTGEDVPTAPPQDVHAVRQNVEDVASVSSQNASKSSIYVSWLAPERRHHRGVLLGYTVLLATVEADERATLNRTVLGAAATSAMIDGMRPDADYRVTVAAFTRVGRGVASQPLLVARLPAVEGGREPAGGTKSSSSSSVTNEPWFLPTVVGFIGLSTIAFAVILAVCLCLRHRSGHPLCSKKGRFLAVPYEGARGGSATPDAYLTYRLDAVEHAPLSLSTRHEQIMLTNEDLMLGRGGGSGRGYGGGGAYEGEIDGDDEFRSQTPVPPYPPAPPPTAAAAASSAAAATAAPSSSTSGGKLVDEVNFDSSGDSTPASGAANADVQLRHHRAAGNGGAGGGGGRKGALYCKAAVLESLGEVQGSAAASGTSGAAGPYATACLYRLSQDSLLTQSQSPRDSRQMRSGQQAPSSSPQSTVQQQQRQAPEQHSERFNFRGGSESSCTDNNGRSSAGTASEAALHSVCCGGMAAGETDDCSCCAGDCSLLRRSRGRSPQLPHFVDALPPPPHYPYCSVKPPETDDSSSSVAGSGGCFAGNDDGGSRSPPTAAVPPTSVATLLRHVQPPPPLPHPFLHQHSAPHMGYGRGCPSRGGGGCSSSNSSLISFHRSQHESPYATGAAAAAAAGICGCCYHEGSALGLPSACVPHRPARARASRPESGQAFPIAGASASGGAVGGSSVAGGKSDDSATLCSQRSAESDSAVAQQARDGDAQPLRQTRIPPHHRNACCCSRSTARSLFHSTVDFGESSARAPSMLVPGESHSSTVNESEKAHLCHRATPRATARSICPGCSGSQARPPSAGLHTTASYPSGFAVAYTASAAAAAAGHHGLMLPEETSSTGEYEEPWEDQSWLYNPSAWGNEAPRGAQAPAAGNHARAFASRSRLQPQVPVQTATAFARLSHTRGAWHDAAAAAAAADGGVTSQRSDGAAELAASIDQHIDPDDEVAAAMAGMVLSGNKAAAAVSAEDSLESSLSSDEGERKSFTDKGPSTQRHWQQSRPPKPDSSAPSRRSNNGKQAARHARRARATGTSAGSGGGGGYSTDSSFVFVPHPRRRPYPKSARRRQMEHHHQHHQHHRRGYKPSINRLPSSSSRPLNGDNDADDGEEEDATDRV